MNEQPLLVNSALVVGGGSAGFLVALSLAKKIPWLKISLLRSPDIGIIGVGEGTTASVTHHLHDYLEIDPAEFFALAKPQWKLGLRMLWGNRPYFDYTFRKQMETHFALLDRATAFYIPEGQDFSRAGVTSALMADNRVFLRGPDGYPVVGSDVAYHIENELFVGYLERKVREAGIPITDGTIQQVERDAKGVRRVVLEDGRSLEADLFVDASGFRSVLLGTALEEPFNSFKSSLFCEKAVVGGWARSDEPIKPYTTVESMEAGWCWQIEHEHRINRGYVYAPDFISDAEAEAEFLRKNPRVERTRIVPFRSGCYERGWVGNVVSIGNANGFVEPLEATALDVICTTSRTLALTLSESEGWITPTVWGLYNSRVKRLWDQIRRFLAVHYKFNRRYDTPFWQACREETDILDAKPLVDYYREQGPRGAWANKLLGVSDPFGAEGYFTMLIGMEVPYSTRTEPTGEQADAWNRIQAEFGNVTRGAYTVDQALQVVRHPAWKWPETLYRSPMSKPEGFEPVPWKSGEINQYISR
jgi:tryptophan halogenase